jgi:flagellar basal body-associated protein FliL
MQQMQQQQASRKQLLLVLLAMLLVLQQLRRGGLGWTLAAADAPAHNTCSSYHPAQQFALKLPLPYERLPPED